jgi:hypothetical protein
LFLVVETLSVLRVTPFTGCNPLSVMVLSQGPASTLPRRLMGAQQRA